MKLEFCIAYFPSCSHCIKKYGGFKCTNLQTQDKRDKKT